MKNIIKSGFKTLAAITLLAAALPACNGLGWPESPPASGINVMNCAQYPDPNSPVPQVTARLWDVWVAKGHGLGITQWFPAEPRKIDGLPFGAGGECTNNDNGPHVATFKFADLGVVDGDAVTVRMIRNWAGPADPYEPNCQEWSATPAVCNKTCNPDDAASCAPVTDPGHIYADSIDIVYKYSASAPYTSYMVSL